jgi:hypothetical protein
MREVALTSPSDNLLERVALGLLHVRFSTTDERIAEWRASNGSVWKGAVRDARAAIDAMSEASNDLVGEMAIGAPVRCIADNCPGDWREDWRDWTGYLAGIHYEPRVGLNFTVCDKWPPENNGDLSDGFREGQLSRMRDARNER